MSIKRLFHLGNSSHSFPRSIQLKYPLPAFNKIRVSQIIFDNSEVETDNNYYITLNDFNEHHDETNELDYFQWFYAQSSTLVSYFPSNPNDGWIHEPRNGLTSLNIGIMKDGEFQTTLTQKFIVELEFCL
jgi:hypothetical protein